MIKIVMTIAAALLPCVAQAGDLGLFRSRQLSSDNDTPVMDLTWRDGVRGRASVTIPVIGRYDETGFFADFLPLIELHNWPGSPSVVPFQLWRGRFSFEAGYVQTDLDALLSALMIAVRFEHESDHETRSDPFGRPRFASSTGEATNFVHTNVMALEATTSIEWRDLIVSVRMLSRLHVASCTIDPYVCRPFRGATGFEMGAELIASHTTGWPSDAPVTVYTSASIGATLENELLIPERRFILHLGATTPGASGHFALFGLLHHGNEVGYARLLSVTQLGLGLRWAW